MKAQREKKKSTLRASGLGIAVCALMTLIAPIAHGQDNPDTTPAVEVPVAGDTAEASDAEAIAFMQKCMGCHTIGGGALSGPDLKASAAWPLNNLRDAVVRMEKNVGPLTAEEVESFTQFLLAPDANARLAAEQERAALKQMAQMEPGNPEIGRDLFLGRRHFTNGGLACSACHEAAGKGGNLALALNDAFTRLGEAPLLSACEKPGFPVMKTIYAKTPLTKQEAMHVVKYLETISSGTQSAGFVPTHLVGIVGALALMALLGKGSSKRAAGTRARLVAEAHRKNNLGGAGR